MTGPSWERFPLALRRPLRWRDLPDGFLELHDPARGSWAKLTPWTRDILVGLEAGDDMRALSDRVKGGEIDPAREAALRRFLASLVKVGYLEVRVPLPDLAGAYSVIEELGRGGAGIAYLAEDARRERVVVKRPWGFVHDLASASAAIQREAAILRALKCPAIVAFRDGFEHDGRPHLVRGFAAGETLSDLYDGAPADAAAQRRIAEGYAVALRHLHLHGLLLLDHKPGNLFDDGERVVLGDVGNAEPAPTGRVTLRSARGTAGFTAPEMRSRKEADARTDVWGYGRILAFARTGRMFRRDPSFDDAMQGIPEGHPLRTLCAEDPSERPATIADACHLLEPSARDPA